jgi:phenylalanyl-tRNA synthetase beta chain
MQFSESWLRQFVNPSIDSKALGHALTMAGLEVEEQHSVAPPFSKVVVAEIISAEQHPDADRLRVCRVNAGQGLENLQIVCGAPNARAGIKIPCALVGAELPPSEEGGKPFQIKVGKLRGIESHGMLCSGRELGLGEDHLGILELPPEAPVGEDLRHYLSLDDQIFTIKLTPNKADCLSIVGIAREVAAITGAALCIPKSKTLTPSISERLSVKIEDADLCGRFAGRIIKGVNVTVSTPEWIVQRLAHAGQRSISPLVDLSNYVMLETGQPNHVFDLDRIQGDLVVRWGKAGEQIKLLNEQTVETKVEGLRVGVVADQSGPISLAGIMGGDSTAVSETTQNIYVEAAFWWPAAIAGRARRYNFTTDAGHRFERGVDPQKTIDALEYLSHLIVEICGGQLGPVDDQITRLPERKAVSMRLERAQRVIGIPLSTEQVSDVFTRLGLEFTVAGRNEAAVFTILAPSHRFDLDIEEDLIEEVARLYGFENIPNRPPKAELMMSAPPERQRPVHALRHRLAQEGYQEVLNFGFIDRQSELQMGQADPIAVLNPIASQYGVMRSNLWGGLLQNLRSNLNRGAQRVRIFEIGRVFTKDAKQREQASVVPGFAQTQQVGGLAYGYANPEQWASPNRLVDFFDVKGDLQRVLTPLQIQTKATDTAHPALHPGRSAPIYLGHQAMGWIGELHPRLQQAYELSSAPILFEISWDAIREIGFPSPNELSKFPAVQRDIALVVDQAMPAQDLIDVMQAQQDTFVQKIELFDEFRPQKESASMATHEKSLAFRITLVNDQDTLLDKQVEASMAGLLKALQKECKARLR